MLRRRRFASPDREYHVAALDRQARISRRLHDQQALGGPEILAQVRVEANQVEVAPALPEAESEAPHSRLDHHVPRRERELWSGHRRHVEVAAVAHLLRDQGRLLSIAAAAVLDLHCVTWVQIMGELDEFRARPRLVLLAFSPHAGERRSVELRDDVSDLEPGLGGRAAWGHALDPRADLVRVSISGGIHDHADPAAITAEAQHREGGPRAGAGGGGGETRPAFLTAP